MLTAIIAVSVALALAIVLILALYNSLKSALHTHQLDLVRIHQLEDEHIIMGAQIIDLENRPSFNGRNVW